MVNDKSLNEFTHVVLDEIHERDSDLDFCLLVAKKLQRTVSGHVKIVLMSATLDDTAFRSYFSQFTAGSLVPCPVLNVEGRTFTVTTYFIDSLNKILNIEPPRPEMAHPKLHDETYNLAAKLITHFDALEIKENR
jgi:ATP-dependent RNA helicase TDRD9